MLQWQDCRYHRSWQDRISLRQDCLKPSAAVSATVQDQRNQTQTTTKHKLQFNDKIVGIIGLDRIGSAIAKRAEAFGCPLSYCSGLVQQSPKGLKPSAAPSATARDQRSQTHYKYCSNVVELAANCESLIVACVLTSETHHIVTHEVIDALGPQGVLVNIGVDEAELVAALLDGRLGGAGIVVFENEPPVPEEILWW